MIYFSLLSSTHTVFKKIKKETLPHDNIFIIRDDYIEEKISGFTMSTCEVPNMGSRIIGSGVLVNFHCGN